MFEQVEKQGDEKQYFLFVGQDGCWRVGPDVSSYSGSVLKHPKKSKRMPPKAGWLYYLDDKWNNDETLQLMTENDEPGKSSHFENKEIIDQLNIRRRESLPWKV